MIMTCEKCMLDKKKSRVMTYGGASTLLTHTPYYDEDGKLHQHDPNWRTHHFTCSNGHEWTMTRRFRCSNCDFGKYDIKITWKEEQIGKL